MFYFILTLIFLNSYSVTWGAPANIDNMISNWLSNLTNSCGNQFLASQISSQIQGCQVSVPPYHEKQFECLIFYDINKQLCEAVGTSKLALNEDYSTKFQEHQDVSQLCNVAKDWTFSDIGEVYNRLVRAVFHDSIRCSKVCTVGFDDILNVDANYVCKYIKWGNEMLKSHIITPESTVVISAPQASAQASGIGNTDKAVESVTQNKIPGPKTETNGVVEIAKENIVTDNIAVSNKKASSDTSDIQIIIKEDTHVKQTEQVAVSDNNINKVEPVLIPANTASSTKEQTSEPISKDEDHKDKTTSEMNKNDVEDKKPPMIGPKKDGDLLNQVENPKPQEIEDDVDPDEDDLLETQIDEDNPSLTDIEPEIEDMDKKPVKNNDISIYNNDISQKELYPNTIPDDFGEDDDHFFPFFLTAIIMVILIYVLYHNKSKVSKVFLGLVVEGRQSNRRRNSRGHAYRRLDTLEQAMSANTAAPPSKIIY